MGGKVGRAGVGGRLGRGRVAAAGGEWQGVVGGVAPHNIKPFVLFFVFKLI